MKYRLLQIIGIFIAYTLLLMLQKPIFAIAAGGIRFGGCLQAMWHGLPMDMTMAGYLTILPALLVVISVWARPRVLEIIAKTYIWITSGIMAIGCVLNAVLYPYWGFPLDTTPLFYFATSPAAAMASASAWQAIVGVLGIAILTWIYYIVVSKFFMPKRFEQPSRKILTTVVTVMLTALLFIPIRGGVTVSTMNLSRAYFCSDMRLNHAAVDPLFSLMYSASHSGDFKKQFRFMEPAEAAEAMATLHTSVMPDSLQLPFLPDIQIIILESFSSHLMPSLGGEPIATNLDSLAKDGLLFTNIYSSSFRTDRALPAILNGYPAQPTSSIMKYVGKVDSLPAIAKSLKQLGYSTSYFYGGDANFTNMKALLVAGGYDKIVSDKDFPLSERMSKWGAHDDKLMQRAIKDVPIANKPAFTVIQTSSSHEPFEVPYTSLHANKRANAFAYADSCLGAYMSQLAASTRYDSTLVVIVPDHYGAYPEDLTDHIQRHRIPLVITGGAAKYINADSTVLASIGSQTDIAATLLSLVGADTSNFAFSQNLLNPERKPFAYFSEPSWIAMLTPDGYAEYSVDGKQPIEGANPTVLKLLEAYIQTLYDDIASR